MKDRNQCFRLNVNVDYYVENIVDLCKIVNLYPKNIIEIGIGDHRGIQALEFVEKTGKLIAFEPNPEFYRSIVSQHGNNQNLTILNKGIYKEAGVKRFYDKWACTFIEEMFDFSGAKIQDLYEKNEKDVFECYVNTIDNYDDGQVELLCMDCESCELFVLQKLISRPIIIQIETHSFYSEYKPFGIDEIYDWFYNNNYTLLAMNESDSVYIKKEYLDKTEINCILC